MEWFWYFVIYSFLGFLLEVAFARVTRARKRDRKCLFLFPLCPVYGLGAVGILLLPDRIAARPALLFCGGVAIATAAEYGMALFYERLCRVSFWDYRGMPLNLHGRVCLPFSLAWGMLAFALVRWLHPAIAGLVFRISPAFFFPALFLLTADSLCSCLLLRRAGSTEILRWYLPDHAALLGILSPKLGILISAERSADQIREESHHGSDQP